MCSLQICAHNYCLTLSASSNQEDKMEAEESASSVAKAESTQGAVAEEPSVLDTSVESKGEGSESLVVHVDEPFMSELDAELAESTTPKKSEGNQDVMLTNQVDNKTAEAVEGKEKGESELPEKANKTEKSPVGDAKKDEKGDEKVTPAKASSSTGKDSSSDKKSTSSAGAATSRSKRFVGHA